MQSKRSVRRRSQVPRRALQDVTNIISDDLIGSQEKQSTRQNTQARQPRQRIDKCDPHPYSEEQRGFSSAMQGTTERKLDGGRQSRHKIRTTRTIIGRDGRNAGNRQEVGTTQVSDTERDEVDPACQRIRLSHQHEDAVADADLLEEGLDSSQLDLSDDHNMFSFSGSLLQATPLATEASSFALKRFKRRPRQPSMLSMVQQRIASTRSSLAGSELDNVSVDTTDNDIEDIEDDFQPDLAGTPARLDKSTSRLAVSLGRSSRPRSSFGRVDVPSNDADAATANTVSRTRSSARRSSQRVKTQLLAASSVIVGSDDDHNQHNAQSPSTTSANDSIYVTAHDKDNTSDDASPSLADTEPHADMTVRDEVAASPEDSEIYADPTTQHTPSPDRGRGKRRRLNKLPSTSDLQSMLPRRRRLLPSATTVRHADFDYSSDTTASTDDESFRLESNIRSVSRTHGRARRVPHTTKQGASHTTGRTGTTSHLEDMSPNMASSKSRKDASRRNAEQRLRGTATVDGIAVDDLSDAHVPEDTSALADNSSVYVTSISDDLEAAKRKFAEIDRWEMDFENVTPDDTISSSQGWR